MSKDALLEAFIRSDASPDGKWWIDVPVGLSVGNADAYATVDAVCLTSREPELPETYPDHVGTTYVAHDPDQRVGVTKVDAFQTLRGREEFAAETAVLVAVERADSSVGTVGDLLAYEDLLLADWDWTIEERILVSETDNDHVNYVCRERGVRAVRVA